MDRSALLEASSIEAIFVSPGVDLVDYTKGILECFLTIEPFLDKYPYYQGQSTNSNEQSDGMTTMMNKPLTSTKHRIELKRFISTAAQAPASALLLDYDGTLAPFSTDRQQAFPYTGVTTLLQEIMNSRHTRVVIITGRSAHEVAALLGVDPIPEIWGSHGLQRLRPDGTCEMPRLDPEVSEALSDACRWLANRGLQHLSESKPGGIAVHWRGLSESTATQVREQVLRAWLPLTQNDCLSLLEFDGGMELRTPDVDKSDVVRTILDEIGPAIPVAYLGDDTIDEPAFQELGTRGLSILVRPEWRRTFARLWLKPPGDLLDFLTKWRQSCCGPKRHGLERFVAPGGGSMSNRQDSGVPLRTAAKPFFFKTSEHLLRICGEKATTLSELLQALRRCPPESVFQHTFRTLQEHHFIRHGFSNDFAQWALSACHESALGERLASVDIREFTSLEELRQCLVGILESFLIQNPGKAARTAQEPFYFCAADIFVLPTGFAPDTLAGFVDGLRRVSVHSIHHHFIEARLRLKLMSNDFSQWLLEAMNLPDTARAVNRIDIHTATLENVRQQIICIVERALQ